MCVAINGLGRIGRAVLKIVLDTPELEVVFECTGAFARREELRTHIDAGGDPRASNVDLAMTMVVDGDLVKVMSWYDNEWGYANQMVREARSMVHAGAAK